MIVKLTIPWGESSVEAVLTDDEIWTCESETLAVYLNSRTRGDDRAPAAGRPFRALINKIARDLKTTPQWAPDPADVDDPLVY